MMFIILILKVAKVQTINQFRPISICNFIYKVIGKIIVTRLSKIILRVIFPNQRAFVQGWWIEKNLVIAQILVHKIKKHKSKNGLILLKMDMHKAYDRLEWCLIYKALNTKVFSRIQAFDFLLHQFGRVLTPPKGWQVWCDEPTAGAQAKGLSFYFKC